MIHDNIPDKPDRDTDYHRRTLYAKAITEENDTVMLTMLSSKKGQSIKSDTWRENYR